MLDYNNMMYIQDGAQDTFYGIMIIIAFLLLLNAFGTLHIYRKKVRMIHDAKRMAIDSLSIKKVRTKKEEMQ